MSGTRDRRRRRGPALSALAALALLAAPAAAQDVIAYETEDAFDDAVFALEQAIISRGLVVDHVAHVGEMLERTRAAAGGEQLFAAADVLQFCSATLSREVMTADRLNIAHCPYGVFVSTQDIENGPSLIGYRAMPAGEMQKAQALLDEIAREAAGGAW